MNRKWKTNKKHYMFEVDTSVTSGQFNASLLEKKTCAKLLNTSVCPFKSWELHLESENFSLSLFFLTDPCMTSGNERTQARCRNH